MNSYIVKEILRFDPEKPSASIQTQIIATISILILSTFTFTVIMRNLSSTFSDTLDNDKEKEYKSMTEKGITKSSLAIGEFFNGSIHAPISEELFFRFLVFKIIFVRIFKLNPHVANILQAFIFGSLHMTNTVYSDQHINMSIAQSISSGISGLINGYSYYYTNSILPAIAAHMINNLCASYDQVKSYSHFLKEKQIN